MIIYVYGNKKFKKEINTLLLESGIKEDIEDIGMLSILKSTIKEFPNNIFLIDNEKIIDNRKLINKIQFFKPKDGIDKEFLEQYGVGDICFNSMNGFVQYILSRLHHTPIIVADEIKDENIEEEDEFEFNNSIDSEDEITIEEDESRDLENIICIDDIFDSEMVEVMNDFSTKKNKMED